MKKWIFVMMSAPFTVHSETENFNMALTGEVVKDYCSLALYDDSGITDIDAALASQNGLYSYELRSVSYNLGCSSGSYTISIESGDVHNVDAGGNLGIYQAVIFIKPMQVPDYGFFSLGQPLSTNYTFSGSDNVVVVVDVLGRPIDGVWENIGDTYDYTLTNVITIESL